MIMKKTEWSYYIPEYAESKDDAREICIYYFQEIYDAEEAAKYVTENLYEEEEGAGPNIVIISPDGLETLFETHHMYEIHHSVKEIMKITS